MRVPYFCTFVNEHVPNSIICKSKTFKTIENLWFRITASGNKDNFFKFKLSYCKHGTSSL